MLRLWQTPTTVMSQHNVTQKPADIERKHIWKKHGKRIDHWEKPWKNVFEKQLHLNKTGWLF